MASALLTAQPPNRLSGQSRLWRPDERTLITDFSYVRALAATPDWLFAATTHGLLIYDRRAHRWQPPVTSLDGYPPDPVRGAVADPAGNAVYLLLGLGWARYDLLTRAWDRGAGSPPVPAGAALSPEAALNDAPAVQALRALILTDPRLRTYRFTAAARTPDQPDLYLGTNGMGVVRVDPATAQSEPLTYGLLAPGAGGVTAGPGGVWVATNTRPAGGGGRAGFTWITDDLSATATSEGGGAALGFTFLQGRRLLARGSTLWLATERGLYAVDNASYRSRVYDAGRGLPTEDVTSVAPAPDGVWAGTTRGLAVVTADGGVTRIGGPGTAVLSLLAVGESLWAGTATGPAVLAPGAPDLVLAPAPPSLRVPIVGLTRSGTVLVLLTERELAWSAPAPDTWHLTPLPPALGRPTALAGDEGGVWVGGTTGLAWVDARTGTARALTVPFDVPAIVRDIVVDRSFLWVATDSGLVRFDRDAARR